MIGRDLLGRSLFTMWQKIALLQFAPVAPEQNPIEALQLREKTGSENGPDDTSRRMGTGSGIRVVFLG
jgi:hypothetical protein